MAVVVLAALLPSTAWCTPHLGVNCVDHNSSRIGALAHNSSCGNSSSNSYSSSSSSTVLLLHRNNRMHQASTAISRQQLSMLQLWEDGPLCSRMPPTQAKQLTRAPAPVVNQQRGHHKGPAPWTGRTNYTTMEETSTGEEVLAGTFFLNECPIVILFDSGASNDFMSFTYAKKAKLSLVASGAPYVISTPRG
jgi:hypothetical protein